MGMKFLLVFLVLMFAIWLWRHNREAEARERRDQKPAPHSPKGAQRMVVCQHCGMHLPVTEALAGQSGTYCCEAHLRASEG
jgi:uncharacterized protein